MWGDEVSIQEGMAMALIPGDWVGIRQETAVTLRLKAALGRSVRTLPDRSSFHMRFCPHQETGALQCGRLMTGPLYGLVSLEMASGGPVLSLKGQLSSGLYLEAQH